VAIQYAFTHTRIRAFRENYTPVEVLLRDIFVSVFIKEGSRDSSIGIATGYGLGYQGVEVRVPIKARIFSSPRRPDRLWVPLSLLSNGYRGLPPGIKRPGSEVDHSPPTSVEVKKMWLYISTLPYPQSGKVSVNIKKGGFSMNLNFSD
jgi:hypothetical protein